MNLFILSALILLLAAQSTLAQWETLNADDAYGEIPYLATLRDVGISFVIQKGKYESTKAPLPGKDYMSRDSVATIERRNTSTVTYYRWNLTLVEAYEEDGSEGDSLVNTTFIVSYRPSNSNFLVTSYRYNIDPDGNAPVEGEEEGTIDFDGTTESALDTRPFNNGTSDLSSILSNATDDVVSQAILNGDLPDSEYSTQYVYDASIYTPGTEGSKTLTCSVKLSNSEGNYFLIEIRADYDFEDEDLEEEYEGPRYTVQIG